MRIPEDIPCSACELTRHERHVWYRESCPEQYSPDVAPLSLMADHLSDEPVPDAGVIVRYLRTGGILVSITDGLMVDALTGESTGVHDNHRFDGVYGWGEGLAYYVERHHLVLPPDFTAHILEYAAKPPYEIRLSIMRGAMR